MFHRQRKRHVLLQQLTIMLLFLSNTREQQCAHSVPLQVLFEYYYIIIINKSFQTKNIKS